MLYPLNLYNGVYNVDSFSIKLCVGGGSPATYGWGKGWGFAYFWGPGSRGSRAGEPAILSRVLLSQEGQVPREVLMAPHNRRVM